MKKLNKKGFTLIEMLVVIAIIAILVAVIVPTVSSATGKAKAATDAANLRSAQAEATIDAMNAEIPEGGKEYSASELNVPAEGKYDKGGFSCIVKKSADAGFTVEVKYGNNGIDYYAAIADTGKVPTTTTTTTSA